MMRIVYGAGNEFRKMIEREILLDFDMVVDTFPEQYKEGVCGYRIYGLDEIKRMTEDDHILITSAQYYAEIEMAIRSVNEKVNIIDMNEAGWRFKKIPVIEKHLAMEDKYSPIGTEKITDWVESAISDEVGYWDRRIPKSKAENDKRLTTREFVYRWNKKLCFQSQNIIVDVGCGPMPSYGNRINGNPINYFPVDPLAFQYRKLYDKHSISVPVMPSFAIMEALTCFYHENYADYVIVDNALDHSIDILRSFIECLRVTKLNGYLLLQHMEAEGIHNDFEGLHKWNIESKNRDLIFFDGGDQKVNISELFKGYCEIEIDRIPREYRDNIVATICKKKEVPPWLIEQYDDMGFIGNMLGKLFEKAIY